MNQSVCAVRLFLNEDFERRDQPLFWADAGHEPSGVASVSLVTNKQYPVNVCKWCGCLYAEVD